VIAAFVNFLDLFSGRFGWSELLDLLRQSTVYPQFQLSASDLDTVQQWVVGAGIRWGLSGRQRKDGGLPDFEETSWRAGLDRLLMGYSVDSEDFVDGLLPYSDIEGRGALPLGGLCQFIEVIDRARHDFQQNRTVGDWSETLLLYVEQLFGDSYQEELVELRSVVSELDDSIKQFHSGDVGFGVIREWLNQSVKESRSSTGFLRGQLTFCSMLPMRSIPFRVVCLIGLNDGVFPKNDNHDTFDLMGVDSRPGDRSPRADDRYQFLEAMLAARSHLYLSYIGQSIRTNDEIPPSVVVTEFLEVLEAAYGVTNLLVRHPLHPFSRQYFRDSGDSRLFSYDSYNCKTAETLSKGRVESETWWQGSLTGEIEKVQLADLLRFYANPQKYFIKNCLGIRLDAGEELPEEREMFELDGLDKYHLEQQMIRSAIGGELDDCYRMFRAEGRWPLGNSGKLAFEEQRLGVGACIEQLDKQEMGERIADLPVDLSLGRYRLLGTLSNLHENGVMLIRYGKLRGRDLLSGWIHHLILNRLAPPATTKILATDTVVGFGSAADSPDLEKLITLFVEGCLAPSRLYIEPAFAYARQLANKRSRSQPIDKALQVFTTRLENGYEPEWELLLRGSGEEIVPGALFEPLCLEIMCSILGAADEQ
jgi:exodeoxyribonuclease V gamma subunit